MFRHGPDFSISIRTGYDGTIVTSAPNPITALRRNIHRYLRSGRLEEADEALRRLQREDPLAVQTRGLELELLIVKGRLSEAQRLAKQLLETFPSSARIHYLAGRAAYRRKAYAAGAAHFNESLRIADHWKTRWWLGKTLTQSGDLARAEPLLVEIVEEHPIAGRDLAWLYERMGEVERALRALDRYLEAVPDDEFASSQRKRLRAEVMDPDALIDEIEALAALGEPVPTQILPKAIKQFVEMGELARAKELAESIDVTEHPQVATSAAWTCHRAHAPDLAYTLFVATFEHNQHSPKFFSALEADALRAGRGEHLLELYRARAEDDPKLWGRVRRLSRRLGA